MSPARSTDPLSLASLVDGLPGMAYRRRDDAPGWMLFVSEGCTALTGYRPEDFIDARTVSYADLIHPADRERVRRDIAAALERRAPFEVTYRLRTAAGAERWVRERGRGVVGPDGGIATVDGFISETAAPVPALPGPDDREAAGARELTTLLEIARNVAATLELEPLLGLILDEVGAAVEYHSAGMLLIEGDMLVQLALRRPNHEGPATGITLPLAQTGPVLLALERGEPLLIPDVWGEDEVARGYRRAVTEEWLRDRPYVRSWVGVPLRFRGRTLGLMVLAYDEPNHFTAHHVRLLTAVAAQAAVAVENARLYAEARRLSAEERAAREAAARQLDRLSTLRQITGQLLAAVELEGVLRVVTRAAGRLCQASGAMVGLIDDDGRRLSAVAADGEPRAYYEQFKRPTLDEPFFTDTATGRAIRERRTVVVEDYATWSDGHALQAETVRLGVRAFVVAPLLVDGAPIGVLWVNDTEPRTFAAEDVSVVQALADQAALAIEHARLLALSREAAVLEERARLARDLHDSVTQSVFSVGLMTNAALGQYERGLPIEETLRRIKAVSQGALSEMRALLYELHPAALAEEGLIKALQKLVAAIQVRVEVPIRVAVEAEGRLGLEAETAVFRIVQEALGNAAKYAQATEIQVAVREADGRLLATVADDGVGFDPAAPVVASADGQRGGMGMRSMRERAVAAGLTLRVESAPGAGTRVTVLAPLA
jgi:PAS domain S-box-containing protein